MSPSEWFGAAGVIAAILIPVLGATWILSAKVGTLSAFLSSMKSAFERDLTRMERAIDRNTEAHERLNNILSSHSAAIEGHSEKLNGLARDVEELTKRVVGRDRH